MFTGPKAIPGADLTPTITLLLPVMTTDWEDVFTTPYDVSWWQGNNWETAAPGARTSSITQLRAHLKKNLVLKFSREGKKWHGYMVR